MPCLAYMTFVAASVLCVTVVNDLRCDTPAGDGDLVEIYIRGKLHVGSRFRDGRSGRGGSENLAITTRQDRYPRSVVRVSKVNVATRTSPTPRRIGLTVGGVALLRTSAANRGVGRCG